MKSLQRYFPVLLLILLLVIGWQQRWWRGSEPRATHTSRPVVTRSGNSKPDASAIRLNRHSRLQYTRHARCRMDCRQVTEQEVAEILAEGTINMDKSDPNDKPCPTYALEGHSDEGQHLRVVFAPCGDVTRVITCIDLDKDWSCDCR